MIPNILAPFHPWPLILQLRNAMTRAMSTTTGAGDPSPLRTHIWTSNIPDGEFVRFFLSRDWSNTPLGPLETWPVALRLYTLQALADSRPVVIYWCVCPLPPSPLFSLYDTHKPSPRSCCFRTVSSRLLFCLFFLRLGFPAYPPFRYTPACLPPLNDYDFLQRSFPLWSAYSS